MTTGRSAIRLGIVDSDSAPLAVLVNRLDQVGWQHHVFASAVPAEALVSMRLDALVIDVEVLGPQSWSYLDTVCARLPSMGILVLAGPSTVASACARCGWAPTTGSPSPATPRS